MATPPVLEFDADGLPYQFDFWLMCRACIFGVTSEMASPYSGTRRGSCVRPVSCDLFVPATLTADSPLVPPSWCDCTTVTLLTAPVPVSLANPSWGPVVARASTVLPCPAAPSGSLTCFHLPSFSKNLVIRTGNCGGSGSCVESVSYDLFVLATLAPDSPLAPPSWSPLPAVLAWHALSSPCLWPPQVPAPAPALTCTAVPSLCRGAAARRSSLLLVSADHCSSADSPHRCLGPSPRPWIGPGALVSAGCCNYTHYTTVFPLRSKVDVFGVLIDWIIALRHQLSARFEQDLQTFTLPASPQQNGIAENRIGLVMDVARTSMIHAAAPHFLWPFAVRYATHQLNLWPRVSVPEALPTPRWTGEVGDASACRVWGALSLVRDTTASKLSHRTLHCVFLGFSTDAPPWQFYHPISHGVLSS
ncbi:unnamed protein product [Closterium sp. NIES-53]